MTSVTATQELNVTVYSLATLCLASSQATSDWIKELPKGRTSHFIFCTERHRLRHYFTAVTTRESVTIPSASLNSKPRKTIHWYDSYGCDSNRDASPPFTITLLQIFSKPRLKTYLIQSKGSDKDTNSDADSFTNHGSCTNKLMQAWLIWLELQHVFRDYINFRLFNVSHLIMNFNRILKFYLNFSDSLQENYHPRQRRKFPQGVWHFPTQ